MITRTILGNGEHLALLAQSVVAAIQPLLFAPDVALRQVQYFH